MYLSEPDVQPFYQYHYNVTAEAASRSHSSVDQKRQRPPFVEIFKKVAISRVVEKSV